jgi:glycosyltransferase involved in cell wall biosynthesis
MKNKKFFYVTDPFYTTVKDSQVTNWLEVIAKHGYNFNLIIVTPLNYIIKNNKHRKQKISQVRSKLKGKVIQIPILKSNDPTRISQLIRILGFFLFVFPNVIIGKKVIIQTRSVKNAFALNFIQKLLGAKVIFDVRGASAEEYINERKLYKPEDIKDNHIKKIYLSKLNEQMYFVKKAYRVSAVSEQLKNYLLSKSDSIKPDSIMVVPGAADKEHFFFDEKARNQQRKEFGLSDKDLCYIYTGRLESHWHMKEFIMKTMSNILKHDNTFFLCVTPDLSIAKKLIEENSINTDRIKVFQASYNEINQYLCAADFGILFREDIMTNNVASPTKFPEYMLAGLPTIISKGVGDYSRFVADHNTGLVIENGDQSIVEQIVSLKKHSAQERIRISEKGVRYYSKQASIQKLLDIYESI